MVVEATAAEVEVTKAVVEDTLVAVGAVMVAEEEVEEEEEEEEEGLRDVMVIGTAPGAAP